VFIGVASNKGKWGIKFKIIAEYIKEKPEKFEIIRPKRG